MRILSILLVIIFAFPVFSQEQYELSDVRKGVKVSGDVILAAMP